MLQQTQVKTVLPYYHRFLRTFPTIKAVDRASKEKVLALWSGLGYYRRAENLKKAASIVMREYGGKLPREFDALRRLPGVGSYTAGALMSIAFHQAYPALDGNTRRVLARLFDIREEFDLREISKRLVSRSRPGEFNQALMELGSTICLPRNPSCPVCPLARFCATRGSGQSQLKRLSSAKRRIKKIEWPLVVIENRGKILLRRRPLDGMLGGLWEVPGGERENGETLKSALYRHLNGLAQGVKAHSFVGEIRHRITRYMIRAPVFLCSDQTKIRLPHQRWRWFPLSTLRRYPLSSLSLKAIRLATKK
jgi:A/G-specific adenine glycosylase